MIDSNSLNSTIGHDDMAYIRLWRSVIITAARDACLSAQLAYDNYNWINSSHGERVCELANISHRLTLNHFLHLNDSEEFRNITTARTSNLKSKFISRGMRPSSKKRKEPNHIQTELFT